MGIINPHLGGFQPGSMKTGQAVLELLKSVALTGPNDNAGIVADLLKALTTGALGAYGVSGGALMPEDLEYEAWAVLWGDESFPFLQNLPRTPATNDIHEYTLINGYGKKGSSVFYPPNGKGRPSDIQSERANVIIRSLGVTHEVTGMMEAVRVQRALKASNAVAISKASALLDLNFKTARAAFFADNRSAVTDSILPWAGLRQQVIEGNPGAGPLGADASAMINMRGYPLERENIRGGNLKAVSNWGRMTDLFVSPLTMDGLEAEMVPTERLDVPRSSARGPIDVGTSIASVVTQGGRCLLHDENILSHVQSWGEPIDTDNLDDDAPSAPTIDSVTVASVPATSEFLAADAMLLMKWMLSAVNDSGESLPTAATAGHAITTGDQATIAWTGNANVKSYKIYRNSVENEGIWYLIGEVAGGAGALTFIDRNYIIPGCDHAFGVSWVTKNHPNDIAGTVQQGDTVALAFLTPVFRKPLAITTDSAINELIGQYAAMMARIPSRLAIWYNIGKRS